MSLITIAIHTYSHATALRQVLEREGIRVTLQNVSLADPKVTAGVRVRIPEEHLPLALRIVENPEVFAPRPEAADASKPADPLVMLPVDFARHGARAAALAFSAAKAMKARVLVVHAFETPTLMAPDPLTDSLDFPDPSTLAADAMMTADANTLLDRLAKRLRADMKAGRIEPAPFDTIARQGLPEDVINDLARRRRPRLIVMGTRGADRRQRDVLGSVTAEVLDTVRVPVCTIPDDNIAESVQALRRALFFAVPDQQDIVAIDTLHRLLPEGLPEEVILASVPSKRSSIGLGTLLNYCQEHYPGTRFTARTLQPSTAVAEMMRLDRSHAFDFIAVPNRHRNVLARFFNPTLAHRLLFHSDIPMLVIPV